MILMVRAGSHAPARLPSFIFGSPDQAASDRFPLAPPHGTSYPK